MRSKSAWILAVLLMTANAGAASPESQIGPSAEFACTAGEKWNFVGISKNWAEKYKQFLSEESDPIEAMASSSLMRKIGKTIEAKVFSIFWKYRILHNQKYFHLAAQGYNWILKQKHDDMMIGVKLAALSCLNEIQDEYPGLFLDKTAEAQFMDLAKILSDKPLTAHRKGVKDQAIFNLALQKIQGDTFEGALPLIALLDVGSPYSLLLRGFSDLYQGKYPDSIANLKAFMSFKVLPEKLRKHKDAAALSLARAYVATEKYDEAIASLKSIDKKSNYMVRALSELSWIYYYKEDYASAMGVGFNLQGGGFQSTFTPESSIVSAMSLNELCQYPPSLKALKIFHFKYKPTVLWLRDWYKSDQSGKKTNFYAEIVNYLDMKEASRVPARVMSEWVSSPIFIANQERINLLEDEKKDQGKFFKNLSATARGKANPYFKSVAVELIKKWKKLRRDAPKMQAELVAEVNTELTSRNMRMLKKLHELSEMAYLIKVEIFNGASSDIVWMNSHPEFKDFAKKMRDSQRNLAGSETYNWGAIAMSDKGEQEIWEDEIGSLEAAYSDNCKSKEKYMKVQIDQQELK